MSGELILIFAKVKMFALMRLRVEWKLVLKISNLRSISLNILRK